MVFIIALFVVLGCKPRKTDSSKALEEVVKDNIASPSGILADDEVMEVQIREVHAFSYGSSRFYGKPLHLKVSCTSERGADDLTNIDFYNLEVPVNPIALPVFKAASILPVNESLVIRGIDLNKKIVDRNCKRNKDDHPDSVTAEKLSFFLTLEEDSFSKPIAITIPKKRTSSERKYEEKILVKGFGSGDMMSLCYEKTCHKRIFDIGYQTAIHKSGEQYQWPAYTTLLEISDDESNRLAAASGIDIQWSVKHSYDLQKNYFIELWVVDGSKLIEKIAYTPNALIDENGNGVGRGVAISGEKWQKVLKRYKDVPISFRVRMLIDNLVLNSALAEADIKITELSTTPKELPLVNKRKSLDAFARIALTMN